MRRTGCLIAVVVALVGAAFLALLWIDYATNPSSSRPEVRLPTRVADPAVTGSRGLPAVAPDGATLLAVEELLGPRLRRERCGPYTLLTDVADGRLLAICHQLATDLEALYVERFGLRLVGEPAEAIVLFSNIATYRAFAAEHNVPLGYAGYALAARGLAVFHGEVQPIESFVKTLAHELTHLLHRRALGVNLPPWLSEGLADAIGDTATPDGFRDLVGVAGSEVQAQRLQQALGSQRAGDLRRLLALRRGEFDADAVSFDYEHSALLTRFLFSEPELAERFRSFLSEAAQTGDTTPEALESSLEVSLDELDQRFTAWLESVI